MSWPKKRAATHAQIDLSDKDRAIKGLGFSEPSNQLNSLTLGCFKCPLRLCLDLFQAMRKYNSSLLVLKYPEKMIITPT